MQVQDVNRDNLYIIQLQFEKSTFLHMLSFLLQQDYAQLSMTCRQLHAWMWTSKNSRIDVIKEYRLWKQCIESKSTDTILESSATLTPSVTTQQKKGNQNTALIKHLNDIETVFMQTTITPESEEKGNNEAHQLFYRVNHDGVTLWKGASAVTLNMQNLFDHVKVLPEKMANKFSRFKEVYTDNHLLLINGQSTQEESAQYFTINLNVAYAFSNNKSGSKQIQYLDVPSSKQLTMEIYAPYQKWWPGHDKNSFYLAKNSPHTSLAFFSFEQGMLKCHWETKEFAEDECIEFKAPLQSSQDAILLATNRIENVGMDIYTYVPVVMILNPKNGHILNHRCKFRWDASYWLFGDVIAYQPSASNKLKWMHLSGKKIGKLTIAGAITHIKCQFATIRNTCAVVLKGKLCNENRVIEEESLKITINYQKKFKHREETHQLTLQSTQSKPLTVWQRVRRTVASLKSHI